MASIQEKKAQDQILTTKEDGNKPSLSTENNQGEKIPLTAHKDRPMKKGIFSQVENANIISLLHFLFGLKLIGFIYSLKKKKRSLNLTDLGAKGRKINAENFEKAFTRNFHELNQKYPGKRRVIGLTLFRIFKKDFFIQLFWQAV